MKSKLNPVLIIMAAFLLKIGIIDNWRFQNNNGNKKHIASSDLTKIPIR